MSKKRRTISLLAFLILLAVSLSVLGGDLLPLQGNVDLSGTPVSSGGLVVEIWDGPDVAGSNLVYNSTDNFTGSGNISSGKFDIVLGSVGDELNLEYGKTYYFDLFIAGNNMNFSGQERQVFMSSVGIINSSFLNTSNDYELNSLLIENKTAITNAYLNISDGITPKFFVSPDGKVGIGTSSPTQELNVIGDANITSNIIVEQNLTVQGDNSSFAGNVSVSKDLTVDSDVYLNHGSVFRSLLAWLGLIENDIYLNATERLADNTTLTNMISAINPDSYDPTSIAFLNETTLNDTYVRMDEANNTYARLNDANTFTQLNHFQANVSIADNLTVGGNALYVDSSSGNVGIGTTNPQKPLHINTTVANPVVISAGNANGAAAVTLLSGLPEHSMIISGVWSDGASINNIYFYWSDNGKVYEGSISGSCYSGCP